jgi:hypothetical protein
VPDENQPQETFPITVTNERDTNTKKRVPLEVLVKNENVPITTSKQGWDIHWEEYQQPGGDNVGLMMKRMEFEKQLKSLTADGWELVGVVGHEMFFKRPK